MKNVLIAFLFLLLPLSAFAHKISAFVDFEGDKVTVMSYFSDGAPVKGGKVEVYDKKTGELLLTGKTDENGEFSFKLEKPTDLKVVVTGELGHKAVSEVEQTATETKSMVAEEKTGEVQKVDSELLRKILREEIERQLKPIRVELFEIRKGIEGTSFKDIFAGFGWILGIFGAVALVLSRRKDEK
jgi:nickel transport protein